MKKLASEFTDDGYEKLEALAAQEKGKEKRVTKRLIYNLKKLSKFAYAGGSADAVSVQVSGQRSLWLRLDMPTAVSGTYPYDQHTITVRIGCQQP